MHTKSKAVTVHGKLHRPTKEPLKSPTKMQFFSSSLYLLVSLKKFIFVS